MNKMANLELVDQWNNLVSYKITLNNLTKPDEQFIFKALVNLLRLFNYDADKMIEKATAEAGEALRFKVEFCRIVDKLYKVSDPLNTFVYYDLINPSPKKTVHLIKHLLNYYLFCKLFREETLSKVDEKIKEHEGYLQIKINNQLENEKFQNKMDMIDQKLCEYDKILPELENKITEKKSDIQILDEKIDKLEVLDRNHKDMIYELKIKEEEIRNKIVSEEERKNLLSTKENLDKAIQNQKEIEQTTRESNQERLTKIKKFEEDIKNIENTKEMCSQILEDFTSSRDLKPQLMQTKSELTAQKMKNEKLISDIQILQKNVEEKETKLKEQNAVFKKNSMEYEIELNRLSKFKAHLSDQKQKLDDELHEIEIEIIKQENNREFMTEYSEKLFERMSNY